MPVSKLESALLRLNITTNRHYAEAAVVAILDLIDGGSESISSEELFMGITQQILDQAAKDERDQKNRTYEDVAFWEDEVKLENVQSEVNITEKIGPWSFETKSGDSEDK